jgi:predicted house-cleaning NTP pyrophosphatase (Maf/HAM1 superfamily)
MLLPGRCVVSGVQSTTTHFKAFTEEAIQRITERGTALQCCGGFVVEEPEFVAARVCIEGGDVSAVQGVDVAATQKLVISLLQPE